MEYRTETVWIKVTSKQKLLKNKTICWFLYGDPDYFEKMMEIIAKKVHEDFEKEFRNMLIYGTSHPEMYDQT